MKTMSENTLPQIEMPSPPSHAAGILNAELPGSRPVRGYSKGEPGDADHFLITLAPLDLAEVYALADHPSHGAVVVMSGMVRNQTDGKAVVALEYQAYEPMALRVFANITAGLRHQWPDVGRVVIHHRTGRLNIGEISVLIGVGSPHRSEAFAACQYVIDTLKQQAPIWKKEWFEDGSYRWANCC
jgi:molybdopterin synthase catalytic subunit